MRSVLLLLTLLGGALEALAESPLSLAPSQAVAGEYLVGFRPETVQPAAGWRPDRPSSEALAGELARLHGGVVLRSFHHAFPGMLARLSEAAVSALRLDPRVAVVEPNVLLETRSSAVVDCRNTTGSFLSKPFVPPSSPQAIACPDPEPDNASTCVDNWGLDRIDQREPRGGSSSYLFDRTGDGVTVYVVDGGVAATHQELQSGRLLPGYNVAVTLPANPSCQQVAAASAASDTSDCQTHSHGTHVASIIAGNSSGVAKNASIVPVRYLNPSQPGGQCGIQSTTAISALISAFEWVIAHHQCSSGPAVANFSSNDVQWRSSALLRQTLRSLVASGVALVQSASNEDDLRGDACEWTFCHPEIPRDGVIVVGGTEPGDGRWRSAGTADAVFCNPTTEQRPTCGSNSGPCVDLWAPAGPIVAASKLDPSAFCRLSGTSMASPHVAGVAALLLEDHPDLPPAGLEAALKVVATSGALDASIGDSPNLLAFSRLAASGAPVGADDHFAYAPGSTVRVLYEDLLANDLSWSGGALEVVSVLPPEHGSITSDKLGFTYTPSLAVETEAFGYTLSDGVEVASGTITMVAARPFAVDDHFSRLNSSIQFQASFLVANDLAAGLFGGSAAASLTFVDFVELPADGTLSEDLSNPGLWTFTPSVSFPGQTSATYEVRDAQGLTAIGTVYFSRNTTGTANAPGGIADLRRTAADTATTFEPAGNDRTLTSQPVALQDFTQPRHGTVTRIAGTNQVIYQPAAGFAGLDTFTYRYHTLRGVAQNPDNVGAGSVAIEVLPVAVVSGPPVAVDDSAITEHNTAVTIDVLANDSDPDGSPLVISEFGLTDPPACGAVVLNPDQTVTYSPATGLACTDTFSYTVRDADDEEDSATVTVQVRAPNQPPNAVDDAFSSFRNQPFAFTCGNLLANDSDPDQDPLTVTSTGPPSAGSLLCNACGCTLTPPAGFVGLINIPYSVSDSRPGGSDSAVARVTVANRAPVANPDVATAQPGTPVSIPVLANDSDPDGDAVSVAAVTQQPAPGAGSCTVAAGNTQVVYTPPAGFLGQATCGYTVTDGLATSAPATITITIGHPPDARGDQLFVPYGLPISFARTVLLGNDFDSDGDALTISAFNTAGLSGNLSCPVGGTSCTYTPPPGFTGVVSFSYTASDGHAGFDTAPVKLKIGVTQTAPVAGNDLLIGARNTPRAFTIFDLLANDSDADGDVLTPIVGTGPRDFGAMACTTPNYGCTYTPSAGFVGPDRFPYTVSDGVNPAVTAWITAMTLPPTPAEVLDAREDQVTATTYQQRFIGFAFLKGNDFDPQGDPLTFVSFDATGLNGTLDCTSDSFGCLYRSGLGFSGTTRFKYTVRDPAGNTDTAWVKIKVSTGNAAPVAAPDSLSVARNGQLRFSIFELLKNDFDAENDPLGVTVFGLYATHGSVACGNPAYWCTYTPHAGYSGPDLFRYVASDGIASTGLTDVAITVTP